MVTVHPLIFTKKLFPYVSMPTYGRWLPGPRSRRQPCRRRMANKANSAMLQLFRSPPVQTQERWLPAAVVFGEGLFVELDEARIEKWQSENSVWLKGRLDDGFILVREFARRGFQYSFFEPFP